MLVNSNSTASFAKREAGGKGLNLYLLTHGGFSVPHWVVLGASHFEAFRKPIADAINEALQEINSRTTPVRLEQIAEQIRSYIVNTPLPDPVYQDFKIAYAGFGSQLIAVRSSALDEDSSTHSFAGQLSSFLYVDSEARAAYCMKECWASAFSARSLSYRAQNDLKISAEIRVAVVFQQMIDSEKSGVLFTCDPLRGDGSKITINSVYGVGEGLVSGLLDGDTFLIDKSTARILHTELADKKSKLVQSIQEPNLHLQEVPVAEEMQKISSLSETELSELAKLGCAVENFYRFPQDIEWAFRDGKLFLLQSRPVTTPVKNQDGLLYIWDNSNIVESYGGMTLPLTFSFAHHVYHSVYVQFCEILLVPQKEIRKMDYFLRNMLGLFYGRVYYNLLNWYKLTSILPGFKYNRSFMETMMGTQHSLADEIADRIKPPGFQEKTASKLRRFVTGLKFLYFHFTIQSMVDRFLEYFHEVYSVYRKTDYSKLPADEIYGLYQELEQKLLMEWKAPIINDYLCMVHFGLLKKLTSNWLAQLGPSLQNDLLCGEGKLESAEPTRELIRMTAEIELNPSLKRLIEGTRAEDCLEALKQSAFTKFFLRVERYIDLYGFRCMNEMKLEEKDLYQDPSFLFVCLKNYLRSGQTDLETYARREKEIRLGAETKVKTHLKGLKRVVFLWSLGNARRAVKNRENTRFCRTRIYGVGRAMFNGIGKDFTSRGIIKRPEDIFYLQLQELAGALQGTLTIQTLSDLVELRREEYERFADFEPAPRFMTRGPVYWMNEHTPKEELKVSESGSELPHYMLKGTGCCPGTVEGVAKIILSPQDDLELNGEILVTLRTDPGWIPLYPSASALLVERGGLLSHSAIVAREMGLPTIVGVNGLIEKIKTGMRLRINGESGLIEILDSLPSVGLTTSPPILTNSLAVTEVSSIS